MGCTTVVAEIGISHCGLESELFSMMDDLQSIGVDHIKVQLFGRHPVLSSKLADFVLSDTTLRRMKIRYPAIHIGASVFSPDDAKFAYSDMGCDFIKVPSGRTLNDKLLRQVSRFEDCERQMSTGMLDKLEVSQAFGVMNPHVMYHCISQYPPPKCAAALGYIDVLWETYKCEIGWSDHYPGIDMCIAAVACGAGYVEKHYGTAGPDRRVAADKFEMCQLLEALDGLHNAVNSTRVVTDVENELKASILKDDEGVS